ncbi:MAG: guanine deaminase [bacterium]|nr:guanine deaminase [Betaproteobacteria bacterium]
MVQDSGSDGIRRGPLFAVRGSVLHFPSDPGGGSDPGPGTDCFEDGLLVVERGHVQRIGPAAPLLAALPPGTPVVDHSGCLVMPGFVDTHVHHAQTDVIASGGSTLLEWLERHTFPVERGFADPSVARATSAFFLDELARNGTTTALVFGTVHRASIDALFEEADARNLRLVAGKAMMDRNCPEDLRDTPQSAYDESRALIERWHGSGRLGYAISPRFACTSSDAQLTLAGRLARECPDVLVQGHVAENVDEVAWAMSLFPQARSYLDVYERFGLLRNSVYAHCIHLDAEDRRRMAALRAAAAFCPTSNLFLGSGLFDLAAADAAGVQVGMATDVGAGTSFSMLRTLAEAYKVVRMTGRQLSARRAFHLATMGGARALGLDDRIGSFLPGREADFVVLDPAATAIGARRDARARTLEERLFALMILGDDRNVRQTYVMGVPMLAGR